MHLSLRVSIRINAGAVGVRSPGSPGRKRESRPSRKNYCDYCVNGSLAVSDGNSKDFYGSKLEKRKSLFSCFLDFCGEDASVVDRAALRFAWDPQADEETGTCL